MIDKKGVLECTEVPREHDIKAYFDLEKVIQELKNSIKEKVMKPSKVVPFFQPGRMLKVDNCLSLKLFIKFSFVISKKTTTGVF